MKIGLISDTHIYSASGELPPPVAEAFRGVDLILHAGDIDVPSALDWLERLAPVVAARGNADVRLAGDPRVKDSQVLTLEGLRVGVVHDIVYPGPPWRKLEETMERHFGGPVDVLVFGDTHIPLVDTYNGVLLVNPGSLTFPGDIIGLWSDYTGLGSVGLLTIEGGQAQASILRFDKR